MSGNTLPFSSSLNPQIPQERSRTVIGSSQAAGHVASVGYPYSSPNTGPSASASFGVGVGQALNDSLAQSRPQYQPGYLLSLAQSQAAQTTGQRHEEAHLIPTRAKVNTTFPRNTSSDFGSESMFENASNVSYHLRHRLREATDDEDGPPTSSVADIVNDIHMDSYRSKLISAQRNSTTTPSPPAHQTLYVIVFGYPPSRYSSTVAHFQSIVDGGTSDPEMSSDAENAFKIGYKQPWEAARAWRRNGEIISGEGGRWMVGVKWADPLVAEQILGPGARISTTSPPIPATETPFFSMDHRSDFPDPAFSQLQHISTPQRDSAPSIGTPLKLAPSASAFRKDAPERSRKNIPVQMETVATDSPGKGMFGQVSDLIFGW
ncbi:hypothetical protein DFH11DRAFT_1517057 [Phellopilus nigrolimitatus]|nr:hypothetical protein DFH11DRAFT_1517057 [Phellopilus nigrolimitatus]